MIECPEHPSDLGIVTADGKDEWWEGQQEVIGEIANAFTDHRFVLANMPTGSGKTIVAVAIGRLLGLSSVSMTHTIGLQHQYTKTLPWATIVTGRSNYPCDLSEPGFEGIRADKAPCAFGDRCPLQRADGCGYYSMLYKAAANPTVVLNYAYGTRIMPLQALRITDVKGTNPFHRDLLVCDEGDLAEQAVVSAAGTRFYPNSWKGTGTLDSVLPRPPFQSDNVTDWVAWATLASEDVQADVQEAKEYHAVDASTRSLKHLSQALARWRSLNVVRNYANEEEWIVGKEGEATIIRPIWGTTAAGTHLWGGCERTLFMSATLGDPGLFMHHQGLPVEECYYLDVESTFPIENRPVFYWPVVSLNYKSDDGDYEVLASAIEFIANQPRLRDKKGIVHTGSFRVAKALHKFLKGSRYRWHITDGDSRGSSIQKTQIIEDLAHSSKPIIAVSPSLATGVDIPYEIGFQIIAKVPFARLGDPIVKARRDYGTKEDPKLGRRNYDAEAMNTVVQACGRGVRAPDDQAVCYVLDSNFWPLYKRTHTPKFFSSAVQWLQRS